MRRSLDPINPSVRVLLGGLTLLAVLAGGAAPARSAVFDERGFKPNRDYFSQLPYEHIDPLTGNLLLTFTDLVLPGNAGFDLRIQRTYNSKIYRGSTFGTLEEDSWAGVGWTLHFGRVFHYSGADAAPPVVEMPDGSQHRMYHHVAPPPGCGSCFVSRDHWIFDKNTQVLKLPNGMIYTFGRGTVINSVPVAYATEIRDPFLNKVTITYDPAEADVISQVAQDLGGQTRTVTFQKETAFHGLQSMTYNSGIRTYTWQYTQTATDNVGFSILTRVMPPIGQGWRYQYNSTVSPKWELTGLTTPFGGQINFTYQEFESRLGDFTPVRFRGIRTRTAGGRDIPAGTWTYAYAQGTGRNQTTIAGPCSNTVMTFLGVGNTSVDRVWKIGLLASKTVSDATSSQTEQNDWRIPQFVDRISDDDEMVGFNQDTEIYVPLLERSTITREGRSYVTTHSYNATNFNDYGRPFRTDEAGDLSRTFTRTFDYGFGTLYIKDKIGSETLTEGGESFVKSYSYIDTTGFRDAETIHGIRTTFAPTASGNVASTTDASGHTTGFNYTWGVLKDTTTPLFPITRAINPEGTVASETRRSLTTNFLYDDQFRPTRITPPLGNPTVTVYDNTGDAEFVELQRGAARLHTDLDGFGRSSGTSNGIGDVKTDLRYDACGRRTYESYPFTTANIGTTLTFDALDRLVRRDNPDSTFATFDYMNGTGGIALVTRNERSKVSTQTWKAFGDPEQARLASLRDEDGKLWQYAYNGLGSLLSVVPPVGPTRNWTYYGPSEPPNGHGLLKSERHPENENQLITYSYYDDGMLKTRTDPAFGTTTFVHDANHRPFHIERPGTAYDTDIRHDESDNRILLQNGYVRSDFAYDNGNRLTLRTDVIGGISYGTGFVPDGNDNVQQVNYRSGFQVFYDRDAEDRITAVRRPGAPCPGANCYANGFAYHPSGAPSSFKTGDGTIHNFTYDADRYWIRSLRAGPSNNLGGLLDLDYQNYDGLGNVGDIVDRGRPQFTQHFAYDNLDRLLTANGVWGPGSFGYDAHGNRTSKTIGNQGTAYTYNTATLRLDSASGGEPDVFGYDRNGNLLTQSGRTYTYAPTNLMETATVAGTPPTTTTYRYDGDDLRKLKSGTGSTRFYLHGLGSQLLSEYEELCPGQVQLLRDYVYAGTRLIAGLKPNASAVSVALTAASSSVSEGAGSAGVALRITTANNQPTLCPVTVRLRTSDGTARAGSDYQAVDRVIVFPTGTPNGFIRTEPVPILNDTLDEDDETFKATLSEVVGASLGAPSEQTITILDDDPPPTLAVNDCTVTEGNGPNVPCTFTVSLSAASGKTVSVSYATANGTARAGLDYVATAGPLSFPPGVTSQPVAVQVIGDLSDEPDETFTLNLSNPTNATIADGTGLGTIVDDDAPPTISIRDVRVSDRNFGTIAYFTVSLSVPSGFPVSVNYATADGSATAGQDYVSTSGTLSFPIDTGKLTVAVPIIQDARDEGTESFLVNLSGPVNATLLDGQGEGFIVERSTPALCAGRLDPLDDQTGLPVDLLISEISPANHIEVYNPTSAALALRTTLHQLTSPFASVALSALAPTVVVPARGYARLPWPNGFTDTNAGGEILLYRDSDFENSNKIVDFVCWGVNPHGSRKAQAEAVGKWSGPCAPPLSGGAIHRLPRTRGTTAADYDVAAPPSPMSCAAIYTVTRTDDHDDSVCDSDCTLREAVNAANLASGPDTIFLPAGPTYTLGGLRFGGFAAPPGPLVLTGDTDIVGDGARATVIDGGGRPNDIRVFEVASGVTVSIRGLTLQNGNSVADGGAIASAGTLTVTDSTLRDNTARDGGAIAITSGQATLRNVTLSSNLAAGNGGALTTACPACTVTLLNATLSGNRADGDGGAVYHGAGSTIAIRNSTVTANQANGDGSGVGVGGGIAGAAGGTVNLRNTLLAGNTALGGGGAAVPSDCTNDWGGLVSEGYNLIGTNSGCTFTPATGDQIGSPGPIDPLLGPLANNRGPANTHALLANSPAIDTANPAAPGPGTCEPLDERSFRRPQDGNADQVSRCDKGSFELCPLPFQDVTPPLAPFVAEVYCRGISSGCSSNPPNYCPGNPVTRAQMAVFLVGALGEQPSGALFNAYFSDVPDDGFAGYINRLVELGITGGCGPGLYCPNTPLTRAQMAVFLVVALEERPSIAPYNQYFDDIANDGFAPYINRLFELGITGGCAPRQFCPNAPMTRGEMAVFLTVSFFSF